MVLPWHPLRSVNAMGGQDTLPSSSQTMAATISSFVYEDASIAQVLEHVEVEVLQLHHVGGMKSTDRVYDAGMSFSRYCS